MTERWRKKLGDLDGTGPSDDVFDRAHEGPQHPDDVVPFPKTSTRIVTGIAAFAVFALAISVFAIPALRMNDRSASIVGAQLLPLWPERSLDDLDALQARADSGEADAVWATDPEEVARRFGEQVLGWDSVVFMATACEQGVTCDVVADEVETSASYSFGPPTGAPSDPFRIYTLRYDAPCDVCPSPTTVRLYQPLETGDGQVWAVLEARSTGAELDVRVGQTLGDGDVVRALVESNGATAPTLAYRAGPGDCGDTTGATGSAEVLHTGAVSLSLEVETSCAADTPGYMWAATTWKPMIGSGGVFDPLMTTRSDPIFSFVAVPVTFLATRATGTFTEPPDETVDRAEGTYAFTDDRFGISIDVPESWAGVERYNEAGQVGFHVASGDIGFQDAPNRIERVIADVGEVVLFVWTEPTETSVADDVLPDEGFDEGSQIGATTIRGEFRGDGLLWHYLIEAAEGDDQIPERFLPTLDAMIESIRFEPWEAGETRNAWTAIEGPGEDTASWVVLDRDAVGVAWIGDGYIVIDAPDGCSEGERTVVGGWPVEACPDGTTIGYDEKGDPFESNPQGFRDPALVYPAIVAHDGHLLVLRSNQPS